MVTIGFPVSAGSNGRIGSKSENKKEFTLMAKLWAGRFGKETDLEVNDFNSSISFDCRLYKEDITGSMAHAAMLGKQGIIAKEESDKIIEGLKGILADIEAGKIHFSQDYEDIHMNVEQILTERIGDAGKRLHTARSRNDQVALDMRLYVKRSWRSKRKFSISWKHSARAQRTIWKLLCRVIHICSVHSRLHLDTI